MKLIKKNLAEPAHQQAQKVSAFPNNNIYKILQILQK